MYLWLWEPRSRHCRNLFWHRYERLEHCFQLRYECFMNKYVKFQKALHMIPAKALYLLCLVTSIPSQITCRRCHSPIVACTRLQNPSSSICHNTATRYYRLCLTYIIQPQISSSYPPLSPSILIPLPSLISDPDSLSSHHIHPLLKPQAQHPIHTAPPIPISIPTHIHSK
jgi:hypothetical protein